MIKTHLLTLAGSFVLFLLASSFGGTAYCDEGSGITRNIYAGPPFTSNDPYFPYNPATPLNPGQWHIENQAPETIDYPDSVAPNGHRTKAVTIVNVGLDANITPAWEAGYTGRGITLGILDDGFELAHPDLDIDRGLSIGFNLKKAALMANG